MYTYNIPGLNFKGGRHFLHWKEGHVTVSILSLYLRSVAASNHLHVICQHFVCLTPLFKGHVACWNFTLGEPLLWQFGMFQWLMCFYLMTGHLLGGKRLITWASLLASLHLAATLSSSVLFLPPKATLQPSLDNKRTAPRPIPELPPKTYLLVSSMVKTYGWKMIFRIKAHNSIIILSLYPLTPPRVRSRATVRKYRPSSGKSWKINCLHFLSINSV